MKYQNILLVAALVLIGSFANAGIMIEPYVGYLAGKWNCDACSPQSSATTSGAIYGGRLGYSLLGLGFGVDYLGGSFTDSYSGQKDTYKPKDIGAFVSFDFPILLRVFASYFPSITWDMVTTGNNAGNWTASGNGLRVGVGFKFLPLLSVNVEYLADQFNKTVSAGQTSTFSPPTKYNLYGVSVSLPLSF